MFVLGRTTLLFKENLLRVRYIWLCTKYITWTKQDEYSIQVYSVNSRVYWSAK
jgi:hypothetical protein